MNHTILTDAFDFKGKKKGDTVASKDLLEAGLNVDALVAGGHISGNATTKPVKEEEGAAE